MQNREKLLLLGTIDIILFALMVYALISHKPSGILQNRSIKLLLIVLVVILLLFCLKSSSFFCFFAFFLKLGMIVKKSPHKSLSKIWWTPGLGERKMDELFEIFNELNPTVLEVFESLSDLKLKIKFFDVYEFEFMKTKEPSRREITKFPEIGIS